jgi:hypothetical protein
MSKANEVNGVVMLPPLRDDLRDFEKLAGLSVDVLVRAKGWDGICIGRYLYSIGEWQLQHVNGKSTVYEWWPMPIVGTGIAT